MKKIIFIFAALILSPIFAHAYSPGDEPNFLPVTEKDITDFEAAINRQSWSVATHAQWKCSKVIRFSTYGINSGTAGECIDQGERILACQNDMLGSIGSAVLIPGDKPELQQLIDLVNDKCVGG